MRPLPPDFYDRDPEQIAPELLGKRLIRRNRDGTASGIIVEVEAYLAADDPACHAYRGLTRRNRVMFGPPGRLYVYSIHARYCMNAVTEAEGCGSAVLIRAIEPLEGVGLMQSRRGRQKLDELTRGPARLCEALAVDRALDGWDLTEPGKIWIAEDRSVDAASLRITCSPRIGVTSAQEAMLRFFVDGNPYVSGPKHHHSQGHRAALRDILP